jgi:pyruvate/2-oxoglutarate/acetoin dehydrogenase E1 component
LAAKDECEMREITYADAIREAIREEMMRDKNIFVIGEDIGVLGGIFTVTKSLLQEFGEERVRDTPISETAILGCAIGAAITGMRPIAEIMYMDFLNVCMDQLVNHAAKINFMSGGILKVPIVIRTQCSLGRMLGAQHSQFLPSWFMNIPGIDIAVPSTPYDAKGLLKTAIRVDKPVLFVEFGTLYFNKGSVPEEDYVVPFGKGEIRREGEDFTIIAISSMVHEAYVAAENLQKDKVSVEVIDPRTLKPLDKDLIKKSLKKTGRIMIVEPGHRTCGVGSEISATMVEEAFDYLDTPIIRLATPDIAPPFSPSLQKYYIPTSERIAQAVKRNL